MNEFIIWDKNHKNFTTDLIISGITVNETLEENDDWIALQYIGKKDINGQKIYAECSIVKFIPRQEQNRIIPEIIEEALAKELKIIFDNELMAFCVCPVNEFCNIPLMSLQYYMFGFKVIDTIQENKLGLIK